MGNHREDIMSLCCSQYFRKDQRCSETQSPGMGTEGERVREPNTENNRPEGVQDLNEPGSCDQVNAVLLNFIHGRVVIPLQAMEAVSASTKSATNNEYPTIRRGMENGSDTRFLHRVLATIALGAELEVNINDQMTEELKKQALESYSILGKLMTLMHGSSKVKDVQKALKDEMEVKDSASDIYRYLPLKADEFLREMREGNSSMVYDILHFALKKIDAVLNGVDGMYNIVDERNEVIWSKETSTIQSSIFSLGSVKTSSNLEIQPAGVLAPYSLYVDPSPYSHYRARICESISTISKTRSGENDQEVQEPLEGGTIEELEACLQQKVHDWAAQQGASVERASPFAQIVLQMQRLRQLTFYVGDVKRINIGIVGTQNSGKSTWVEKLLRSRGLQGVSTGASVMSRTEYVYPYVLPMDSSSPMNLDSPGTQQYLPIFYDFPGCSDERKITRKLFSKFLPICDACVAVFDVAHCGEIEHSLVERLRLLGLPFIVLLNKCDLITSDDDNKTPLDFHEPEIRSRILSSGVSHLVGTPDSPQLQRFLAVSATDEASDRLVDTAVQALLRETLL